MSNKALIGYTGFVGSNILRQNEFDDLYNSKNINEISGNDYEVVVCAGAPAEKWKINKEPESDIENLNNLKSALISAKINKLVLISTVDIYKNPNGADEDTLVETKDLHPYGLHRYELEQFALKNFDTTIVRLPGLFGNGIKKNVVFDFLTNNAPFIEQANSESEYQYYNLDNIWKDIKIASDNNLKIINFATEPVSTHDIAKEAFGIEFDNHPEGKPMVRYDFRTKHYDLYGGSEGYIYNKEQILKSLKEFVHKWKKEN
jgi:nucleoside-diphosphate-sugar epimerase